jgi:predicted dinucleotide-utilizing enzyme
VRIGIVGLGTVGSGVVRLLVDSADHITRHAGRPIEVAAAVVRDPAKERDCTLPAIPISTDIATISQDPSITIAALLVGGLEPARSMMVELLENGKDVVTANKALLAEHGPELFELARRLGRSIAFEAAVAGGIPIVAAIGECLAANRIESCLWRSIRTAVGVARVRRLPSDSVHHTHRHIPGHLRRRSRPAGRTRPTSLALCRDCLRTRFRAHDQRQRHQR